MKKNKITTTITFHCHPNPFCVLHFNIDNMTLLNLNVIWLIVFLFFFVFFHCLFVDRSIRTARPFVFICLFIFWFNLRISINSGRIFNRFTGTWTSQITFELLHWSERQKLGVIEFRVEISSSVQSPVTLTNRVVLVQMNRKTYQKTWLSFEQ